MTAEIAILNRHGVALAADSAVTVGREGADKPRVWNTGNKLFSLGPHHDIGVMLHGSADFLGFPWETIIKMFHRHAAKKKYDTVKQCADDFRSFVLSDRFRNDEMEMVSIASLYLSLFESLKADLSYQSKMEFRSTVTASMDGLRSACSEHEVFDDKLSLSTFRGAWGENIRNLSADTLGEVITNKLLTSITSALHAYTVRKVESRFSTGVVFAGFGSNEVFPALEYLVFDGRDEIISRVWTDRSRDLNDPQSPRAYIMPFGQGDIAYTLIEGISDEFNTYIESTLSILLADRSEKIIRQYVASQDERTVEMAAQNIANEKSIEKFRNEFAAFRRKALINPIVGVVLNLPREEMAKMAEAMVDITSLRRRVDSNVESVGGPIDVAVISKGDGVIWMKRKHYFNIDLNRDFLYRKHERRSGADASD